MDLANNRDASGNYIFRVLKPIRLRLMKMAFIRAVRMLTMFAG